MPFRVLVRAVALLAFSALSARAADVPVFNTNDAFAGSLRQAIQDAPPDSTIVFQIPTSDPRYDPVTNRYAITLTSGSLFTNKNLTIDGGRQKITVQRSLAGGTPNFTIFNFGNGGTITLANLTIYNGNASGTLANGGGGVICFANLTVKNCLFLSNEGGGYAGAIYNGSSGNLVVRNCSFVGNRAFQCGALDNDGTVTVDNSTFSYNESNNGGVGGIRTASGKPVTIRNTIVVGNTGNNGTVAADYRGSFTSGGYNLVGTQSAGGFGFNATGDQAGASPAVANLGALRDHGGPTLTLRPEPGSIAIDQGNRGLDANGQPINSDQRGAPRPIDLPAISNAIGGDGSDIGAVETAPTQTGPTFTVTTTGAHSESCTTDDCTLLEAIAVSNAGADENTIIFAPNVGPIIENQSHTAGYTIVNPVSIVGPGARRLAISGGGLRRIFSITSPNVAISGLTLSRGRQVGTGAGKGGGAIRNSGGLTLIDCTVRDSTACDCGSGVPADGGGVFNAAGASLTLVGCTFSGNSASGFGGGAVFNVGTLTATNSTFSGNTAPAGGGILSVSNNGTSLVTLRNCTIANNTATSTGSSTAGGGGYYGEGAVGNTLHHFSNTIVAGNINANNPDLRGYITSEGNNLVGNLGQGGSGSFSAMNGDKVGVNPALSAFGNNGGPTDTWSLLSNSPAIDAGDDNLAPLRDQRHYSRAGTSDIGAFEFNGVPPAPIPLLSVISRKIHTDVATPLDLNLPAVESRTGGPGGNHTVIFTFAHPLASVAGAGLTNGVGNVSSSGIGDNPQELVINLSDVANAQTLTLTLGNLSDAAGNESQSVSIDMGVLVGDSNGDGAVNSGDAQQTRNRSGQTTGATNFRSDYNLDGFVNSGDATIVRTRSGQFIP